MNCVKPVRGEVLVLESIWDHAGEASDLYVMEASPYAYRELDFGFYESPGVRLHYIDDYAQFESALGRERHRAPSSSTCRPSGSPPRRSPWNAATVPGRSTAASPSGSNPSTSSTGLNAPTRHSCWSVSRRGRALSHAHLLRRSFSAASLLVDGRVRRGFASPLLSPSPRARITAWVHQLLGAAYRSPP